MDEAYFLYRNPATYQNFFRIEFCPLKHLFFFWKILRCLHKKKFFLKIFHASKLLTAFVDASLEGWGGVVVEQSGALTVAGDVGGKKKDFTLIFSKQRLLLIPC